MDVLDNRGTFSGPVSGGDQSCHRTILEHVALTKPRDVIYAQSGAGTLLRHLPLLPLVLLGLGSTIGSGERFIPAKGNLESEGLTPADYNETFGTVCEICMLSFAFNFLLLAGIFVTSGLIVNELAGPSAVLSWILASVVCFLSGLSYMEMSSRCPSTGGAYAFSYHALGELPAVLAGSMQTLQYGLAASGIARAWAGKMQFWVQDLGGDADAWIFNENISFLGALLIVVCTFCLLGGITFGRHLVNVMTVVKLGVVTFVIIAALTAFDINNYSPFIPPREGDSFGVLGMLEGASRAFFGYIGFDEVATFAGETIAPTRTIPRAVLWTICVTTIMSVMATFSLVGMQIYTDVSPVTPFETAFSANGMDVVSHITAAGATLTIPVIAIVQFMAQPRLLLAMAEDGLLPSLFAVVNSKGVIVWGTAISGFVFSIFALLLPFDFVQEFVSLGVLMSYQFTTSSVVMMRYRHSSPILAPCLWGGFSVSALVACLLGFKLDGSAGIALMCIFAAISLGFIIALWLLCSHKKPGLAEKGVWLAPLAPFLQAATVVSIWVLFAQGGGDGILLLFGYLLLSMIFYAVYGYRHSTGYNTQWKEVIEATAKGEQRLFMTSRLDAAVLQGTENGYSKDSFSFRSASDPDVFDFCASPDLSRFVERNWTPPGEAMFKDYVDG